MTPDPSRPPTISVDRPNDPLTQTVDPIATAIDRLEQAVARRPGFGRSTETSVTTVTTGLRCSTGEGQWQIHADLPPSLGGTASAPTPGALLRAALGSCLAMGYKLRAAKHGVDLESIRVTVEADSEIAGMLLPDTTAPPGYREIRYHVRVTSRSTPAEIRRVIDEGDALSPLLDVFTRTNTMRRTLSIDSMTANPATAKPSNADAEVD